MLRVKTNMGTTPQSVDTLEEQARRLEACEANLRRHHQLSLAGTLMGATMHEINNRLEALTNYIYLARITAESSANAVEYLDAASNELRSVGEITSRSLAFVRMDLDAKSIDLVELANAALQLHHEKISSKRINVQLRTADSANTTGKRGELLQVLVNLLLNAIDALPYSGNLHLRIALHRSEAIMTVADNGKGIPEALRPCLFQSFKSGKEQGNGLGLWIAKHIIESHQGKIKYRTSTRPDRSGTVFRIALPVGTSQ
jgi:signal transduction histidine kinase